MSSIGNKSIPNASCSSRDSKGEKGDYLQIKNMELSKEIAQLRMSQSKMQSDINFLVKKNHETEFKNNNLERFVIEIGGRNRKILNQLVELSNEFTQIIEMTNRHMIDKNELNSDNVSKNISKSFKQIVTPHTVNGHVLHTPTIRISRFNDSRKENNTSIQNLSNEIETTVNESSNNSSPLRIDENQEEIDENEQEPETSNKLTKIDEESGEYDVTSCSQVTRKRWMKTCVQKSNVSMASLNNSLSVNTSNESDSDDNIERKSKVTKRKSIVKRKSIGSPIPSRLRPRNVTPTTSITKTKKTTRKNLSIPSTSNSSLNTMSFEQSNTLTNQDTLRQRNVTPTTSITNTKKTTRKNSSIPTTSNSSLNTMSFEQSNTLTNQDTSNSHNSLYSDKEITLNLFNKQKPIHSTPLRSKDNSLSVSIGSPSESKISKRNLRKPKKSEFSPVVNLTRYKLAELKKNNSSINDVTEEIFKDVKIENSTIKKRNTGNNKKVVKQENTSTSVSSSSPKKNTPGRPKRARPISFKEPKLNSKMRRD